MKHFIGFNCPDNLFLNFVLYILSMFLNFFFANFRLYTDNNKKELENKMLVFFIIDFPYFFTFIPLFIGKTKGLKIRCLEILFKNENLNEDDDESLDLKILLKKNWDTFLYLFLFATINIVKDFLINANIFKEQYYFSFLILIFSGLWNPKYTNFVLYRHHYFSIILILIAGIADIIFSLIYVQSLVFVKNIILSILFFSIEGIFCCINHYLMNVKFISLFCILWIKGILILIIFLIWNFFYLIKGELKNIYRKNINEFSFDEPKETILKVIVFTTFYILTLIFSDGLKLNIIKKLSPCHYSICFYLFLAINFLYQHISNTETSLIEKIIVPIIQFFFIFSSLVFCEIIILRFCKCDKDILEEQKKRINLKNNDKDNLLSDSEDEIF